MAKRAPLGTLVGKESLNKRVGYNEALLSLLVGDANK